MMEECKIFPIGFVGHRVSAKSEYINNNNVGKDTAADFLLQSMYESCIDLNNLNLFRMNFADPLKEIVKAKFGLDDNCFNRENKERVYVQAGNKKYSPRQLLQREGTELGRNVYGENIWIDTIKNKVKNNCHFLKNIVIIGDVRFANEAKWIRENGRLVHIVRVDLDSQPCINPSNLHEAERLIKPNTELDLIIDNNESLQVLKNACQDLGKVLYNNYNNS